jgi:hypothetical protein
VVFVEGECPDFDTLTPEQQAQVIEMATDFLWLWTDEVFGLQSVTVRPCKEGCSGGRSTWQGSGPFTGYQGGKLMPVLIGGKWSNLGCGRCIGGCECYDTPALRLPGPVAAITQIMIDGVVLAPENYRVDNDRYLVRLDGEAWPLCQNMSLPTTEPGTWLITYDMGVPLPAGGMAAVKALACQFAKAITSPKSCDLPQRIQQVTRQGVTVTVMDDFKSLEQGKTGIWLIDSWVASVTRKRPGGSVRSPDIPKPAFRRTTWGG